MSDARVSYIASTLADVFGDGTSAASLLDQLSASPAVSAFCDDPHTTLLCTTISPSGRLTASNTVDTAVLNSRSPHSAKPHEESKEQLSERTCEVHMLKRERAILPSQQLGAHVMMLTTFDSPLYSLYLTLHNVYGPKLTQAAADIPAAVQQQFIALEQQLHRTLLTSTAASSLAGSAHEKDSDANNSASISSVDDELTYWTELSHSSNSTNKQRAQLFLPHLTTLTDKLQPLPTLDPSDLPRLTEELADTLHDLWVEEDDAELAYPQERMVRLFGVIGRSVCGRVRGALEAAEVLESSGKGGRWVEVKELMLTCMAACEAWTAAVRDLVRQTEWKQRWQPNKTRDGDADDLEEVEVLRERIEQVIESTSSVRRTDLTASFIRPARLSRHCLCALQHIRSLSALTIHCTTVHFRFVNLPLRSGTGRTSRHLAAQAAYHLTLHPTRPPPSTPSRVSNPPIPTTAPHRSRR